MPRCNICLEREKEMKRICKGERNMSLKTADEQLKIFSVISYSIKCQLVMDFGNQVVLFPLAWVGNISYQLGFMPR